jgi:transcriptional regulator with XRE-family HTH domain
MLTPVFLIIKLQMESKYLIHIGRQITEARKGKKIKQTELAATVKMSRASIVNIEKGRQGVPIDKLYLIAYSLGKEIGFFLPEMDGGELQQKLEKNSLHPRLVRYLEKIPFEDLKIILKMYNQLKLKK